VSGREPSTDLSPGLRLSFAALGIAFLASVLAILVDEHDSEWRGWQSRFAELRSEGRDAPTGLRQVWLPELDRVDRCTTCHLGIDDPALASAEQPFRAHGGDWLATHPVERFGCTTCHGGRGEATTLAGAGHAADSGLPDPIHPPQLQDASCGRCHRDRDPPRAHRLAAGRLQIAESNCVGCHEIPGFGEDDLRAPRLDDLGEKLQPGWLEGWLKDPAAFLPGSRMPDFRLRDEEIRDVAAFLLEATSTPTVEPDVDWDRADPERGGELFRNARCVTCHAVDGRGGGVGPELTQVGSKVRRGWLYRYLEDPSRHQPDTLMPRFRWTPAQIADLVVYLSQLVADAPISEPDRAGDPGAGRLVFLDRGCAGCHPRAGLPEVPKIGPSLAEIAARAFDPQPLAEQGLASTLANRVFAQIRAPESLAPNARMPSFRFDETAAAEVALAVLSLEGEAPPPAWSPDPRPTPTLRAPQGEVGDLFRRYRCLSCHRLGGAGRGLSTVDLDRIGSQLQPGHLESFLLQPYAVRVSVASRMPRLGMTGDEARALAGYMSEQLLDGELETALSAGASPESGRELYEELGCRGCHIVSGRGGYVGPDLDGSASRLRPGWIVAWLLEPDRWKPGTLQPDYGLTPDQARDLAAYVMTLESTSRQVRR